ncbi:MAG: outer membrane protein transport protein, partial [Elusimicrobia bacterium]|nr:outer membrane protein transport protein [Elusimicrobiota bacterium]
AGQVSGAHATSVAVPNFGAATTLADGSLAVGLAVVAPYGLETRFAGDSPIRYAATDARLRVVDITPALAVAVNDQVSIGVGVDYYNVVEGDLEHKFNTRGVNASKGDVGAYADANARLNGNGYGEGYHLGFTYRPNKHHQLGVVYHSNVKVALDGNTVITGLSGTVASAAVFGGTNFQTTAHTALYMPQNIQLGYAWLPNDKTAVEVDAAWYDWYHARQLLVAYDSLTSAQSTVLNSSASNPTVYKPRKTLNFGVGVSHQCTQTIQGRAGFYYQAAALPESNFSPAFLDLPRYAGTVGLGWNIAKDWSLDAAYEAVFFHSRFIDRPDTNNLASGYSGSFASRANIMAASLTYRL